MPATAGIRKADHAAISGHVTAAPGAEKPLPPRKRRGLVIVSAFPTSKIPHAGSIRPKREAMP